MTPPQKLFGIGARYAAVIPLDPTTGLPVNSGASATLSTPYQVEGIKTFTPNDPDPQLITHYGDDRPQAQDSLPPTEAMSAVFTTDKTNLTLDAALADNDVRTYQTTSKWLAQNTNKQGAEPQVAFFTQRQALAGDPSTPSEFGKRRVWESYLLPSTRIISKSNAFEQGATDKTYNCIPTIVKQTPWGESLSESNWGAVDAQILHGVQEYQTRLAYGYGNGTLTGFILPVAPVGTTYLNVWVDGTLTTPTTLTMATPAFTLAAAPGVDKLIWCEIQTTAV